jgi:hypothetical protein
MGAALLFNRRSAGVTKNFTTITRAEISIYPAMGGWSACDLELRQKILDLGKARGRTVCEADFHGCGTTGAVS